MCVIYTCVHVGGKKFDMRLYTLVTSFAPLKYVYMHIYLCSNCILYNYIHRAYQYRRGFARFTNARYSSNIEDIYNGFMHLTNVAIQKTAENYDERTGVLVYI